MSLYAIKSESGSLWDQSGDKPEATKIFRAWTYHRDAEGALTACYPGERVVELVEKAEPVEVSEEAGKTLAELYQEICYGKTDQYAADYVRELHNDNMSTEDIFHALDVGWTVKQPRRWYIKTPKEWDGRGERQRFYKGDNDSISTIAESYADNTADEQFTAEEIDKYHLGGFEKVEVED